MNVLWVVNKCCGALHQHIYGKRSTGGLWLDAMLDQAKRNKQDRIVVVNVEKKPILNYLEDDNIIYYTLPGTQSLEYDYKSKKTLSGWEKIINKEKPDAIVLWGTEYPYGLAVISVAPNVPVVIFVQGILDSIGKYYLSGLTSTELKKAVSFRDIVTRTTIKQVQKRYSKQAKYELLIAQKSKNIIVENHWAESYFKKICPEARVFYMSLSISESFKRVKWSEEKMHPHTLMCPAANYPIKGLHMLLKALAIVKKQYPDVKLYVPGTILKKPNSIKDKLKQDGYSKLILSMIKDMKLSDNIEYTGRLTADEMAHLMEYVNCFVMCSAIENHSSTLKEAMTVGTPCISSFVGGVPEYAVNEYNCLLYRFEDYEVLASNIIRIFENAELRNRLSKNAMDTMRTTDESSYLTLRKICDEVCKKRWN